jgi:hypothetical protein
MDAQLTQSQLDALDKAVAERTGALNNPRWITNVSLEIDRTPSWWSLAKLIWKVLRQFEYQRSKGCWLEHRSILLIVGAVPNPKDKRNTW